MYDVRDSFLYEQRRFLNPLPREMIPRVSALSTLEVGHQTLGSKEAKSALENIERWDIEGFFASVPSIKSTTLSKDLNLEEMVQHLLRHIASKEFVHHALLNTPFDLNTSEYLQEGMQELVEDIELTKNLEESLDLIFRLTFSVLNQKSAESYCDWGFASRT